MAHKPTIVINKMTYDWNEKKLYGKDDIFYEPTKDEILALFEIVVTHGKDMINRLSFMEDLSNLMSKDLP